MKSSQWWINKINLGHDGSWTFGAWMVFGFSTLASAFVINEQIQMCFQQKLSVIQKINTANAWWFNV